MLTAPPATPWRYIRNRVDPEWVLAVALTVVAVGLHLVFLKHAGGFWRDEVNTLNLAERPSLSDMANDSFPVLLPCLVRAWSGLGLGDSDTRLRLLGVCIGLGLLAALWVAAWVGRRAPPVLSLMLVGLNGTVLVYGDSLRAFGLGTLLVALTVAALCWFLRSPGWKQTLWLGVAAFLSVQALYTNVVLLAALWLGGWVISWQRRAGPAAVRLLAAGLPAALSLLPYWSKVLPMLEGTPESGVGTLRTVFRPDLAFASLSAAAGSPLPQFIYAWALASLAVVGLGIAAARSRGEGPDAGPEVREPRLLAAVTLLASGAGFISFLWFARLRTEPWYFLPLLVVAAVCFELSRPRFQGWARAVWLGTIAAAAVLAVPAAQRAVQWRFTNADLVAERLRHEAAPEDFVIVTPWNRGISFGRYFHNLTRWNTVPPLADHRTHRYDLVQRQTQTPDALRPLFESITNTLASGSRVWVVGQLELPPRGLALPAELPPPPLKYTGWSTGPYNRNWREQVAQFLSNHSQRFAPVPLEAGQAINENERLELFVAEGWAD
jgi:hypothetical protein